MPYRGNCRPWQKVELLWVLSISACTRIARPGMADKCIDEKATNQPHQPLTVRQRKRVRCFKFFLWILKTNARLDFLLLLLFIVKFCAKVVLKTLPSLKFNWSCCDCENACLTSSTSRSNQSVNILEVKFFGVHYVHGKVRIYMY